MNYKNAWKCKKCPGRNDENGCPNWAEIVMENKETGETKVTKGCSPIVLQIMMLEVVRAANRPAAEMGKIANVLVDGLNSIALQVSSPPAQIEDSSED